MSRIHALLVLLVAAAPSAAQSPTFLPLRPKLDATAVADVIGQLLQELDRVTLRRGTPLVRLGAQLDVESVRLVTTFRVRGVEVEDYLTNEVLGMEVPGRRVQVTVRLDCLVHCMLNVGAIRIAADPDYPDTIEVQLPKLELKGEFPEGEEAAYEVVYGGLRSPWLDRDKASELRRKMYQEARKRAVASFREGDAARHQAMVAREVERLLRAQFPDKRIHVKWGY